MGLFGMHLWSSGKKIVVCEGEVDTMTTSMIKAINLRQSVCRMGAQSSQKTLVETSRLSQELEEIISNV